MVAEGTTLLIEQQIRARVIDSYKALHGLLHPSPPSDSREQLAGLVDSYASKSDWAHLVLALDTGICPPTRKAIIRADRGRFRAYQCSSPDRSNNGFGQCHGRPFCVAQRRCGGAAQPGTYTFSTTRRRTYAYAKFRIWTLLRAS